MSKSKKNLLMPVSPQTCSVMLLFGYWLGRQQQRRVAMISSMANNETICPTYQLTCHRKMLTTSPKGRENS